MRGCLLPVVLTITALCRAACFAGGVDDAAAHDDVARVAAEIDRLIEARWVTDSIVPAPASSDAEFLRRVYLDLTGRIPRAAEVRDFLADDSPDKRRKLVDRLLAGPTYIIHYTNLWRAAMLPEADADQQIRFTLPGFEAWLRSRLAENRNYAEIAREVLTLGVSAQDMQAFNQQNAATPAAFYQAKAGMPENLASATSRVFLGVRIECAQCHDHPFDDWKQQEFWSYAAFFADVQRPPMEGQTDVAPPPSKHSLMIPGTEEVVQARFLKGEQLDWSARSDPRMTLAEWVTSPDNPYFSRAAVNRTWAHHFGIGLVDPLDDFSPNNPPSHPELLDLLAREFVAHDFDFKFMIRAITASRTYQLSSAVGGTSSPPVSSEDDRTSGGLEVPPTDTDPRLFARMPVRAMTPEQIFDSLAQAVGYRQPFDPEQPINFNNDQARQEFLENFKNESESPTERGSTILQALQLMNGRFISDATDLADSQTLAAVIDAPFLDTAGKVEALFLTTLTRPPTEGEMAKFEAYVESGGARNDKVAALGDVFWALLNSSEFLTNH